MIGRLRLEDFRSHKATLIEFDQPVVYIGGVNGAGKSSLKLALQMVLTDRCDLIDGRGGGKDKLVRRGQPGYRVVVELVNGQTVERTDNRAMGYGQLKIADVNREIEKNIAPMPVLTALLGGSFFDMPEDKQRTTLLSLCGADFGNAKAIAFFTAALDPAHRKALDTRFGELVPSSPDTIDERLKRIETLLTDSRTRMRETDAKVQELGGAQQLSLEGGDDEQAQAARYNELYERQRELVSQLSEAQTAASQAVYTFTTTSSTYNRLVAEREKLKPPQDTAKALQQAHKRAEEARTAVQVAVGEVAELDAQVRLVDHLEGRIQNVGDPCPLCKHVLDEEAHKTAHENIAATREARNTRYPVAQEAMKKANEEYAMADRRRSELNKITELTLEIATAKGKMDDAQAEVSRLAVPDGLRDETEAAQAALAEFNAGAIGLALVNRGKLAEAQENHARSVALEAAYVAMREALRKFKTEQVGGKIAEFIAEVNKHAQAFAMEFACDENLKVTTTEGLTYEQLSESERVRCDVAFRLALAKLTGFGFMCVDRVDVLDSSARIALVQLLASSGIRALMLAKVDGEMKAPPIPHVKWMRVLKDEDAVSIITELAA